MIAAASTGTAASGALFTAFTVGALFDAESTWGSLTALLPVLPAVPLTETPFAVPFPLAVPAAIPGVDATTAALPAAATAEVVTGCVSVPLVPTVGGVNPVALTCGSFATPGVTAPDGAAWPAALAPAGAAGVCPVIAAATSTGGATAACGVAVELPATVVLPAVVAAGPVKGLPLCVATGVAGPTA